MSEVMAFFKVSKFLLLFHHFMYSGGFAIVDL
jgi:hypothetical protein